MALPQAVPGRSEGGRVLSVESKTGPSADTIMQGIVSALERAVSGPPNGAALVQDALDGLPALHEALERGDAPAPGELRRFEERVVGLLQTGHNLGSFSVYRGRVLAYAQRGRFDGYAFACEGRSALQLLREEFGGEALFDDLACADLEEIDEELADAAEEAPPIREVPSWVPGSHWWWRAPKRMDMTEEERLYRLYRGEYDG